MNKNLTLTRDAFLDVPTLQAATTAIINLDAASKKNGLNIAAILANVERNGLYKQGGFKSVREYAAKTFDYRTTYVTNLLRIGRDWLDKDGVPALPMGEDWNAGQVEKMLTIGQKAAQAMIEDGLITPDMSAKEVGAVIDENKAAYEHLGEEDDTKSKRGKIERQYDGAIFDGMGKGLEEFNGLILDDIRSRMISELDDIAFSASKRVNDEITLVMVSKSGHMFRAVYVSHVKDPAKKPVSKVNPRDAAWKNTESAMRALGKSDAEIEELRKVFYANLG